MYCESPRLKYVAPPRPYRRGTLPSNFADTFLQYVDKVSQIIVHCDAGYSRSPAVAAALAKALRESDEEFFGHDFCINNHVYTTLLKQLSERKILK